jgi:hypothetical protein
MMHGFVCRQVVLVCLAIIVDSGLLECLGQGPLCRSSFCRLPRWWLPFVVLVIAPLYVLCELCSSV